MRSSITARCTILLVSMCLLFSLVLYAYSVGFLGVSCDEFAKTVIARRGLSEPSTWFNGIWLPLHFVLIAATSLVTGDLLLASRLVSLVFGGLLIVALIGIGRQTGGSLGAGIAATLGATHPLVVLLSATAMVDVCYVSMIMLGLRFYLRFADSSCPSPKDLFAACGLLTLACALHYNAWIAVIIFTPFLLRHLYRGDLPFRVIAGSLLLLGSIPLTWVVWNWVRTGHPLAFFAEHSEYSAKVWAALGWHASAWTAFRELCHAFRLYSPLLVILVFAAAGTCVKRRSTERSQAFLLSLLVGFLMALAILYANGGRPAAFEPRYILLPSVLMISIAAGALAKFWHQGDRELRPFILMLSLAAVAVNVRLAHESILSTKKVDHYAYVAEARDIARVMRRHMRESDSPRMLLEIKAWNFYALPVFLNRVDAIVNDRDLINDPVHTFDGPSILSGDREPVLTRLRAERAGFIAVWSPGAQNRVESWGLKRLGSVDTYTVYRVPEIAGVLGL
jgi:4-amino-4-deoxy-L-arabinose transferase-like glycosyltransferase